MAVVPRGTTPVPPIPRGAGLIAKTAILSGPPRATGGREPLPLCLDGYGSTYLGPFGGGDVPDISDIL